jgi:plasmid maintenance system antidote protein VapI
MIDNRKKYQLQASVPYPHVGELVESYLYKHMSNHTYVAKQLGVAPSTVARYFENASLQLGILWKLSLITNHNFILEIGSQLPIDYPTPAAIQAQNQLADKQKELEDLQRQIERLNIELSVYKNIVGK